MFEIEGILVSDKSAHRSPSGEKYEVNKNLNRDGVSCYCKVSWKSSRDLLRQWRQTNILQNVRRRCAVVLHGKAFRNYSDFIDSFNVDFISFIALILVGIYNRIFIWIYFRPQNLGKWGRVDKNQYILINSQSSKIRLNQNLPHFIFLVVRWQSLDPTAPNTTPANLSLSEEKQLNEFVPEKVNLCRDFRQIEQKIFAIK